MTSISVTIDSIIIPGGEDFADCTVNINGMCFSASAYVDENGHVSFGNDLSMWASTGLQDAMRGLIPDHEADVDDVMAAISDAVRREL